MNKSELTVALATKSGMSKADTARFIEDTLDIITNALAIGGSVELHGFGVFSVTERSEREGRNPATGEPVHVPAKKALKFKPHHKLKQAVNQ